MLSLFIKIKEKAMKNIIKSIVTLFLVVFISGCMEVIEITTIKNK